MWGDCHESFQKVSARQGIPSQPLTAKLIVTEIELSEERELDHRARYPSCATTEDEVMG